MNGQVEFFSSEGPVFEGQVLGVELGDFVLKLDFSCGGSSESLFKILDFLLQLHYLIFLLVE